MIQKVMSVGALALMTAASAKPAEDQFTELPVVGNMTTESYSGFLPVSDSKALHYMFLESQNDPVNDPVIMWFNGGPGCSSLLGAFQELGPYLVNDELVPPVQPNEWSWNKNASLLFVESPAGVGFSVANTTGDRSTNDYRQSQDAMTALNAWFGKFPEYQDHKWFVAGESYGGIYVPWMAWQIYQNNLQFNTTGEGKKINLQGFMVGNGATNWDFDVSPSFPETLYNFNIIPSQLLKQFNDLNCTYYFNDFRNHSGPSECAPLWEIMDNESNKSLTKDLNWYDLYRTDAAPITQKDRSDFGETIIGGEKRTYKRGMRMSEYTPWLKTAMKKNAIKDIVKNDLLSDWLNTQETRDALHIPNYVPTWSMCWNDTFSYQIENEASMWIYKVLQMNGIRMMHYSGDTDGAVPTYGTKRWIEQLNWPIKEAWKQWRTDGQVTGFVQQYFGLDFVTVKGVGHMAPQWAPKPVFEMINNWVSGKPWA